VISCKTFLSDFERKGNTNREQPAPNICCQMAGISPAWSVFNC